MSTHGKSAFIVGLAGPSGSGKSTVAQRVAARLGGHVLSLETYAKAMNDLPLAQREKLNYDAPDALDLPLLVEHVRAYALGSAIDVPIYDFATHLRVMDRSQRIEPRPLLIVEGILALHYVDLRPRFDLAIYLDAPDHVCLHRRKVRDIVERQRPIELILWQYRETVLPMAKQYLLPSKPYADVVIDSEPEQPVVERSLEEAIRQAMDRRPVR
jgi:uridine kinase